MKNLTLILTLFVLGLTSCTKEVILPNSQSSTGNRVESVQQQAQTPYNSDDMLSFLTEYGTRDVDLIPSWNNFFQGAFCGNANWDYTSEGVATFIIGGEEIVTQSLVFQTYTNGEPTCDGFEYGCNGSVACTVRVDHNGAVYERSAIGWAHRGNTPFSSCDLGVFDVEPSGLYEAGQLIEFEPYEFLVESSLTWDLNGDHIVNAEDLTIFLSNYAS